jgi:hypothetical protein
LVILRVEGLRFTSGRFTMSRSTRSLEEILKAWE